VSKLEPYWTRDGDDPNERGGSGRKYICTHHCGWPGGSSIAALKHHNDTGHAVRDKRWPPHWGNARFPAFMTLKQRRTTSA
jgi:hypothetical protein